eukprot:361837_1
MFKLWCKNTHDISTLSDKSFKAMENDILECFGGIRGLLQLALQSEDNLNYAQLLNLSTILNKQETEEKSINNNVSAHFSINSISENSLSKICEYLHRQDEYHLKCTNRALFYCQFGTFQFTDLNSSMFDLHSQNQHFYPKFNCLNNSNTKKSLNNNSLIEKCIENIIHSNDTESMKKLINFSQIRKSDIGNISLLTNTGLLSHLKYLILNEVSTLDTLELFTYLHCENTRNF